MVIDIKLTDKELEIMKIFWKTEDLMTASDIVDASHDRTWKEVSIHIILKSLINKGAIVGGNFKPTTTRPARAYSSSITPEQYIAHQVSGLDINVKELFSIITKNESKTDGNRDED